MLPARLLPLERDKHRIIPSYLTAADHVWLEALLEECERYVGRRRVELEERLKEPLSVPAPRAKLGVATRVLLREYTDQTRSPTPPVAIRRALFGARAQVATPDDALVSASRQLGMSPTEIRECLFADLPFERRLAPLRSPISSTELALRSNHAMVASLLKRATVVRVLAEGDVRALVRAVKLHGLLCTAEPEDHGRKVRISVSGPYSLFRHTLVYGRALASLVSSVARCKRFELRATCALRDERDLVELTVRAGDPVVPAGRGKTYDSKVEERFARDFSKIALDWDVIREPEGVPVRGGWIFPDFLIRHRRDPQRYALVEIVGFWTPEYLQHKLGTLRSANLERLILCIDGARNCASEELPEDARVIRYNRRVPAEEVLKMLEA